MKDLTRLLIVATILFLTAVTAVALAQSPDQKMAPYYGAIEGQILDEEGLLLSGIQIFADAIDDPARGRPPFTYSDKKGRFFLNTLVPGRYNIYAQAEDQGYPSQFSAFFSAGRRPMPKVEVREQEIIRDVVIRLGPKAARVVGRIIDADTSNPVEAAQIVLCHVDRSDNCYSTTTSEPDAQFRFLVPSVPITVKVSAPGYEDWYYKSEGSKEQAHALQLAPGATKEIIIALRPGKSGR